MSNPSGEIGRPINILVLAASKSPNQQSDREYPLCLTEIDGFSVLERIISNAKAVDHVQFSFAFLKSEALRFHLEKIVGLLLPAALFTLVPEQTMGSACTALLAACRLDQDAELLIISANELVDINLREMISEFRRRGLDGGTVVFRSVHPRYSYVILDEEGFVIETAQKQPISAHATAGLFWFAKTQDFVEGAKQLIRKDAQVDGSFFVAPTFNELVLRHKKIGVEVLDTKRYTPLKTDRQVEQSETGQKA